MQGVHSGGTYLENNAAACASIAGPTGSFSRTQGREYRMHPRATNAMPAMRYPSTQTVEAYVHVRFQELGLNMPEIENYVADVRHCFDPWFCALCSCEALFRRDCIMSRRVLVQAYIYMYIYIYIIYDVIAIMCTAAATNSLWNG